MKEGFTRRSTVYIRTPDGVERRVINECYFCRRFLRRNGEHRLFDERGVITRDVARYRVPEEYLSIPPSRRKNLYTVQKGDFVVMAEIAATPSTDEELAEVRRKFGAVGFGVTNANGDIAGLDSDCVVMGNG